MEVVASSVMNDENTPIRMLRLADRWVCSDHSIQMTSARGKKTLA